MPTPQQAQEHNLTRFPYRQWPPICLQGKGEQQTTQRKSKQLVTQVNLAFLKTNCGPQVKPILTAVDMQTGLCMAALIPDKQLFDYAVSCLQPFIIERGRAESIFAKR